ncbi:hypothetical protein [Brevibacterium sediminis]|uniref:hypothetical protein n=1 Tax=Brevibacterium sediminis TaxID=1857024 RepID=UPI003B3A544B
MEALFHLRDFGYEQLTELTLDGLLIRLTESTWVRKGAILSPAERMAALHSLIPPGLALSHDSAWWVHRGLGRAPTPLSFITLPRRRWIADDGFDVHETNLAQDDWCLIDGLPITTEERTLYDLLFPHFRNWTAESPRALKGIIAEIPSSLRHRLRDYLTEVARRPFVAQMRAALDREDQPPEMR